ncbi:MAG: SUMF1/EgtB/PvdO family nonheme iron enzyme [Pseudomonadota bacterium]
MKSKRIIGVLAGVVVFLGLAILAWASTAGLLGPSAKQASTPNAADIGSRILVAEGTVVVGEFANRPEEGPPREVAIPELWVMAHEVTNDQFAMFVDATGYVTAAEVGYDDFGPGSTVFDPQELKSLSWAFVDNASWKAPLGPGSTIKGKGSYPVVHITAADAKAYADWAGGRVPTEEEWESIAIRGLPDPTNPRSGAFNVDGLPIANTWQGVFPFLNTADDGHRGAAPVGSFPPDKLGLYDVIGNVWELTSDVENGFTVIKGGSFLCAANYCGRYRPAARQPAEFSSSHLGFRIVFDNPPDERELYAKTAR